MIKYLSNLSKYSNDLKVNFDYKIVIKNGNNYTYDNSSPQNGCFELNQNRYLFIKVQFSNLTK